MRALPFLLILATVAQAQRAPDRAASLGPRPRYDDAALSVLPAGGGQSAVVDLCDNFSTELTGNYFCLRGDGGSSVAANPDGGTSLVALSAVGSPTTQTMAVCPNGPNCGSVTRQRTSNGNRFVTPAAAGPTGDISCWATAAIDATSAGGDFVSKFGSGAANWSYLLNVNSGTGAAQWSIGDGAGLQTVSGGTIVNRAPHLLVGTYSRVGTGTSVAKLYLDGAQVGTSSSINLMASTPTVPHYITDRVGGGASMTGALFGAGCTEKVLSASTIQQMADSALGKLSGSFGEALTFTRASAWGCAPSDESSWTTLPINRPCIRSGGAAVRSATTNLLLRSEEFDSPAWTPASSCGGVPVVTANAAVAPDGTTTADQIVFGSTTACTAADYNMVLQSFTASAVSHTAAMWLKRSTGTGTIYLMTFDNAGTSNHTVATCDINSTTWTRCQVPVKTMTAATWNVGIGYDLRCAGCSSNKQGAQTIYAWGAQANASKFAADYCGPTAGSTVTCAAETLTGTNPLTSADITGSWEIRARITASPDGLWTTGGATRVVALLGSSFASANTAALWVSVSGNATFGVYDNGAVLKAVTSPAMSAGTHNLRAAYSNGTLGIFVDEDPTSLSNTGPNSLSSMSSTLNLGSGGGSRYLDAIFSDVRLVRR